MQRNYKNKLVLAFLLVVSFVVLIPKPSFATDSEGCLVCHGQPGFTTVIDGKTISLYVDADKFDANMHKDMKCSDCHTGFKAGTTTTAEGPHTQAQLASYNKEAITSCQKCHDKPYWQFMNGPHGKAYQAGDANAPKCTKCHETHYTTSAKDPTSPLSRLNASEQTCKPCHEEAFATYKDNYHGKTLVMLGYEKSAGCTQCHGAHTAQPLKNENDKIAACGACHEGANKNFVGFAIHADEASAKAWPLLFWTKWIMTSLLIVVLGFFYLHTLLWALKDIMVVRAKKRAANQGLASDGGDAIVAHVPLTAGDEVEEYRRFNWFHITMHYTMMFSFMALVFTGMPLRYRGAGWAKAMMSTFGGVGGAGLIHRVAAGITLGYFLAEVIYGVGYCYIVKRVPVFGPDSMFPRWQDLKDLGNNMKYFLGRGPQPKFDRFTYWEKFDYLAVFWGMFAIGATGLMLWFPLFFSKFIPGIVFNVSTIMHSDEAVLAAGFIFIVHWFNTHWRPGKFPMDPVIFTGKVGQDEIKHERQLEWQRLHDNPDLKDIKRIKKD